MKSQIHRAFLLAMLVLALTATACVKAQLHRPQNIDVRDHYSLAFIEFDDQGEPWAPSQLERTIELIEVAQERGRVAVVLFVHGWHNDASKREDRKRDNNVEGFQKLLEVIHEQGRSQGTIGPDDTLIGVYVGWRGRSTDVSLLKPLTFYSRRGAGQRVAGVGTTEAITRVMAAAGRTPNSIGVVIGHSFGGMIVERALAQTLISVSASSEGEVSQLADLVVLINPASQSMEAKVMLSILERNRLKYYREGPDGIRRESPLIVSVTSTSDSATGSLYPMALALKANSKTFRKYDATDCSPLPSQKDFYKKTAGHNRVLHSHVVTARPLTAEELENPPAQFVLEDSINEKTGAQDYSFRGEEDRFTIEELPFSSNDTPYWIMSVPPELIEGHSDIFTFDTLQLLRGLLAMGGSSEGERKSFLVRETGVRPVHVDVLPGGEMMFIERSRRFFVLGANGRRPLALSCWPSVIDLEAIIGGFVDGSSVTLLSSGVEKGGKKPKLRTDLVTFDYSAMGSDSIEWTEFKSDVLFTAAGGAVGHDKVYFYGDGALWVADVTQKKPEPTKLIDLSGLAALSELEFDAMSNRLFAFEREGGGALYEFDLDADPIEPLRLSSDLGAVVDMSLGEQGILLLADAERRRVLQLDCSHDRGCGPPEVFAAIDRFVRPNTVVMDREGNVWVGDLGAESIFGFDRAGKLVRVLDSLEGVTVVGADP